MTSRFERISPDISYYQHYYTQLVNVLSLWLLLVGANRCVFSSHLHPHQRLLMFRLPAYNTPTFDVVVLAIH